MPARCRPSGDSSLLSRPKLFDSGGLDAGDEACTNARVHRCGLSPTASTFRSRQWALREAGGIRANRPAGSLTLYVELRRGCAFRSRFPGIPLVVRGSLQRER